MSFEEICQRAITTACDECGVELSEESISECSKLTVSVAFEFPSQEIERVVTLEKRSHEPARVTHFRPVAALEVIASFAETAASIGFHHPEFAPFAVVHMIKALSQLRIPLSNAEAELFYSIYRKSKTEDSTISDCRKDFEERWKRIQTTPGPPFETTLQRLVDLGLIEEASEMLSVRERVMLRSIPLLFE